MQAYSFSHGRSPVRCECIGSSRARLRRNGFTLVELLVVIAIISVLAALLLPALDRAIRGARSIACINRLKQIGMGLGPFVDEYGHYPSYTYKFWLNALAEVDTDGVLTRTASDSSAFTGFTRDAVCPEATMHWGTTSAWNTQLHPSHDVKPILFSGYNPTYPWYRDDYPNYDCKLAEDWPRTEGFVRKPSKTIYFTEAENRNSEPSWYHNYRHPEYSGNALFFDLHAQSLNLYHPYGDPEPTWGCAYKATCTADGAIDGFWKRNVYWYPWILAEP